MISVIVPVYNMERYLEQCVGSILAQSCRDIELLLIDDGSTDGSLALCRALAERDARIKVYHKENGGQGSARNLGLCKASGDYIGLVDSDDWLEPDMYEILLALMEQSGAGLSICEVVYNDEDGGERIEKHHEGELVMTADEALAHRFDNSGIVTDSPCNKLYRRALFDDIRYPEGRLLEDSAVMYKLIDKAGKVMYTDKAGYHVRCDNMSVSRRKYNRKRCDTILTFTEMADFFTQKEEYLKFVPAANACIAGAVFYNAGEMYGADFEGKEEAVCYIRKCASDILRSGRRFSVKSALLLRVIAHSPSLYGRLYAVTKKR